MKKTTTVALSMVLAGGVLYGCTPAQEDNYKPRVTAPQTSEAKSALVPYSEAAVPAGAPYILFFYADWCPTCVAWEKSVNRTELPENAAILKVNYDEAEALKAQYGIKKQSTSVMIGADGEVVATEADPSMEAVVEFFKSYEADMDEEDTTEGEDVDESADEDTEEAATADTDETTEEEAVDVTDESAENNDEVEVETEVKVEAGL